MIHKIAMLIVFSYVCFADVTMNVVENEFIKIIVGNKGYDQGRFSIETTGGDPSRDNDNNLPLIYGRPKPWTSYSTIAINRANFGFGSKTLKRAGKNAQYGKIISTSVSKDSIRVLARIGGLDVVQTLSLFRNPLTNVEDSVLIEYELTNISKETKNVGFRIMMDTMLGKNDASPFRIGNDSVIAEKLYVGNNIMDYWHSFDSLVSPNVIAQGLLRYSPALISPPDKLILKNWGSLADEIYDVSVEEDRSFIRFGEDEPDTALALYWNKKPLEPRQIRRYRTVVGLGGISLAPGDLSLGLSAPVHLSITDPNEYLIVAYILNNGGFDVNDTVATLNLPKGLELVSGQLSTSLGTLLSNRSRQLVYKVGLDPKKATEGFQDLTLSVASSTLDDQLLVRPIRFFGQPKITAKVLGKPKIQRGFDQFVDIPVQIHNESDVSISNVQLGIQPKSPFVIPSFESKKRIIPVLKSGQVKRALWKLRLESWDRGIHYFPIAVSSAFTKPSEVMVSVNVMLGQPKGKLYYSEPSFFVNDYGYIWIALMDMPVFSGLDLKVTWDPLFLKSVRVSPESWLIDQNRNVFEHFQLSVDALKIDDISADRPFWRMIVGKWHFNAVKDGETQIELWKDNQLIDTITLKIKNKEISNDDS